MIRFSKRAYHYLNNRYFHLCSPLYKRHIHVFDKKHGIEVGGPSRIFERHGAFPVYGTADCIDNCNYSSATLWHTHSTAYRFHPKKRPGNQFIFEAADLTSSVPGKRYDFILSSHTLEHLANPVKALLNWHDLIEDRGVLLLLLPDHRYTFDRNRRVTPVDHLVVDYHDSTEENDLTHLQDIVENHDFALDKGADPETFVQRCLDNYRNRGMHHHVFDQVAAVELVRYCKWRIIGTERRYPSLIFLLAHE